MFYGNENMLKYKLEKQEKADDFSLNMIKTGEVPGLIPVGRIGDEFLVPIADCKRLDTYLAEDSSPEKTADIIRQAVRIFERAEKYMLGDSPIIKKLDRAYIQDDKLCMICIPSSLAFAESDSERNFFRSVAAAGVYKEEHFEQVVGLLNFINSENYSRELLMIKIEECGVPVVAVNTEETQDKLKTEEPPKKPPKKGNLFVKALNYLFPVSERESDGDVFAEYSGGEELPQGITIISVRSTGEEYPLGFGPDIIGTDADCCSICFAGNAEMDKQHCKVYFSRGRFFIEDLGSRGGTYLNNVRLDANKPKALSSADLIRAGGEEMVFSKRVM